MDFLRSGWVGATALSICGVAAVLWACEVDSEESSDTSTPPGDSSPDTGLPSVAPYRYIRVVDTGTTDDTGEHPGADIDAVSYTNDGVTTYATTVSDSSAGAVNLDGAVGEPNDPLQCVVGEFASLGGAGGYITLDFGDRVIAQGSTIRIAEINATDCAPSGADDGAYEIFVSDSGADGSWVTLSTCTGNCMRVAP